MSDLRWNTPTFTRLRGTFCLVIPPGLRLLYIGITPHDLTQVSRQG